MKIYPSNLIGYKSVSQFTPHNFICFILVAIIIFQYNILHLCSTKLNNYISKMKLVFYFETLTLMIVVRHHMADVRDHRVTASPLHLYLVEFSHVMMSRVILYQRWGNLFLSVYQFFIDNKIWNATSALLPNKQDILTYCWVNIGPQTATTVQH